MRVAVAPTYLFAQISEAAESPTPGVCRCPDDRENFARSKGKCVKTCENGRQWNDDIEICQIPCDLGMHYDKQTDACVCDTPTRMGANGKCVAGCPASRPVSRPDGGCRRRYAEDCRKIGKVLPDPITQECSGQFNDQMRIKWSKEVCTMYLEGKITWRQLSNIANDIVTANNGIIPKSMRGGVCEP